MTILRNPFPLAEIPAEQLPVLVELTVRWPAICNTLKLEALRRVHAPELAPGWCDVELGDDVAEVEAFATALGNAAQFAEGIDAFLMCQCGVVTQWLVAIHLERGTGRFLAMADLPASPTRQ